MKNSSKIFAIVTILILQTISSSCEELVEVETPDNQIIKGQVFNDIQTANAALAGLYAGVWDNSPLSGDKSGPLLGTYTDDLDCFAVLSTNGTYDLFLNQQIDINPTVSLYWSGAYAQIYNANAIIEGTTNSTALSVEDKDRIIGEALLMRSILHFYVQQVFGDIPYVTTTDYKVNQSLPKTKSSDVLMELRKDLIEAATLLNDQYRNEERIFLNRKVAELMLAKVHMLLQEWAEAEVLLENIVASELYIFENDITKVFQKSGTHILWQLKPIINGEATKEATTFYFVNAAPSNFALSDDLIQSFSNADLRRQNWMTPVTVGDNTWYRPAKYVNMTNNTTEYSIVFRLEEVYLLLAESLARQGKITDAIPFVNATRERANLTLLSPAINQNELLQEILLEARKEFFTEMGQRFLYLKRMAALDTLSAVKPNWQEFHTVWPIPQSEILLNNNLKPQNNGY